MAEWTVVRFPDGSWSGGGSPDSPEYVQARVFVVEAPSYEAAVREAKREHKRQRGV